MKLKLILTMAIVGMALALPSASNAAPKAPEPTLTLQRACIGFNSVDVILTGFPPFTSFDAFLGFDGGGVEVDQLMTDANGGFNSATVGHVGSFDPVTFTATITWEGGVLTKSLFVDCSVPASQGDCANGAWTDFPDFKNQGQCIAFVNRGP
jgi:hypothetical protein